MLTPSETMFEIRVAVIGYVSVGKTTVINALFGSEYGEVSMRRTTAVVNSFRLSSPMSENDAVKTVGSQSEVDSEAEDDSIAVVSKRFTAEASLTETKVDNAYFRNSNIVTEKTFDICLEEPLHEMRSDTKLVIVDIPGINEAGTSSKYKDYVNVNWHNFDIVVVVMDARQGVNTDEQHNLLELVKQNLANTKDVPVIILCNKVDDPYDKEQEVLLNEARSAVSKLFGVNGRKVALKNMLNQSKTEEHFKPHIFPAVVPISAMHAFVYRCGSRLSFEEFSKMDTDFIEKLGKESYGRQWHRYNDKKKLERAFEAVSDEEQNLHGLKASNFGVFTKVLAYSIGDTERQKFLIRRQAEVAVKRLEEGCQDFDLGAALISAHTTLNALGESTTFLPEAFWKAFRRLKKTAFDGFPKEFSPTPFSYPAKQLLNYQKALEILAFDGELAKVVNAVKELVLLYAVTVVNSEKMKTLSGQDVCNVLGCLLLSSSETAFCTHFGQLKLWLESKYMYANATSTSVDKICDSCLVATQFDPKYNCESCYNCNRYFIERSVHRCPTCARKGLNYTLSFKGDGTKRQTATCNIYCRLSFRVFVDSLVGEMKLKDGRLVPVSKEAYKRNVTVDVPDSLEDPNHFGHVIWKCCQLLKAAEA